jgi:hypothetical protein
VPPRSRGKDLNNEQRTWTGISARGLASLHRGHDVEVRLEDRLLDETHW